MSPVFNLRKQLALSQAQLAEKLGVTQSLISHYENGSCQPSIRVARRVVDLARCRGVDLTLADVYDLTDARSVAARSPIQ